MGSGQVLSYSNDPRTLSWTDGTPAPSDSNANGLYISALQNGFSFTAAADSNTRSLTVHVGGYYSGGTLTAHLSDASAADYVDTTAAVTGQYDRNYTLSYSAASAGQTLTVTWVTSSGDGNVTLNGAALALSSRLSGSGTSAATTANLTAEGSADWIHWGDSVLNRKSGVSAQIANYTVVGSGPVTSYSDDPRALSWTDGAPTVSGSNSGGLYINSLQNGFAFTVPADSNTRRLIVHVGGYHSGGTLTAHLSDGSSPDYEDSPAAVSGQYDRNYTLAYSAASAGQTLTVSWVTTASDGNVTLSGAALSYAGGSIAASGGTPQSATVNTAFARALQVVVRDAGNNPLIGVPVTFTASGTGASAAFSGSPTVTVYTNTVGTATAPAPTANGQAGSYTVTATAAAAAAPANFSLTNAALMTSGGALAGSGSNAAATANLTAEGTADWVHWGGTSIIRKAGVTPQIGNYAVVGSGNVVSYSNDPRALSWTDGTPTAAGTDNNGIDIYFVGNGFSFTAPADTSTRTLSVYAGGYFTGGTLTAHLSDGSAADFVDTTALANSQYDRSYTLTYNAASAGQTLTVSWVASSGTSNVTLSAAALWTAGSSPGQTVSKVRDYIRLGSRVVAIESVGGASTPTFSPPAGTYSGTQQISIGETTPGTLVKYTVDGSTPSETFGTLYTPGTTITVSATTTINAIAFGSTVTDSAVGTAVYTITAAVATPTFSPASGSYTGPQTVHIGSSTPGASIIFTNDGTTPTESAGMPYGGSVTLSSPTTLKAIAYKSGMLDSPVATAVYTFVSVSIVAPVQPIYAATGQTEQFYATVSGSTNQGVTWSAVYGTITSAGLYTAPASAPASGFDTVTAASVAYPSATASAQVMLAGTQVTVSPAYPTGVFLVAGGPGQEFTAVVTPNQNQAVTWSVSTAATAPPYGTFSPSVATSSGGFYTPPPASAQLTSTIPNLVLATSQADSTASGAAVVYIDPLPTPRVISMSPLNGTGSTVTFTVQLTGGGGAPVQEMDLSFNTSLTEFVPGAGCLMQLYPSGQVFVGDDTYTWQGSPYCSVGSATFYPSGNGGTMVVTVAFTSLWSGTTQNVWATVVNTNNMIDPVDMYQQMGQWGIP